MVEHYVSIVIKILQVTASGELLVSDEITYIISNKKTALNFVRERVPFSFIESLPASRVKLSSRLVSMGPGDEIGDGYVPQPRKAIIYLNIGSGTFVHHINYNTNSVIMILITM